MEGIILQKNKVYQSPPPLFNNNPKISKANYQVFPWPSFHKTEQVNFL